MKDLRTEKCLSLIRILILIHRSSSSRPYFLTSSMEQSPSWEAKRFSPSQEIPSILWNPKVHYHIYKCLPPVPILSQIDPAYAPTSQLLKIHLILSPHLRLGLQVVSFPQVSPPKPCIHLSSPNHTCYMPRQTHSSRYNHKNKIGWGVKIIKLLIMYFSPLPCYFVPLSPYILLSTLFSKHPKPTFLPQCERPSFTPIQNNKQNYGSLYLNLYIFG